MSLIGMSNTLKGSLGFKGEKGDSAYATALKHGFIGTEQDWLATLGTSSHFTEDSIIHTATANQTSFNLPDNYTSNSFIDVYINGLRLNSNEYSIDVNSKKINLIDIVLNAGAIVEIVVLTMSTNSLPIIETISVTSTNEEAAGAKAVYNYVQTEKAALQNNINTLEDSVENLKNNVVAELETKLDGSNIKVVTGSTAAIASGGTTTVDIDYPNGFTKANTVIIGKMTSSNNVYYDEADLEDTTNGYPTIRRVALTDDVIRVWIKNTNNTQARVGHYKITLMKVD